MKVVDDGHSVVKMSVVRVVYSITSEVEVTMGREYVQGQSISISFELNVILPDLPVIVSVVGSVTVYVLVPCVKRVADGQIVVRMSTVTVS